MAEEDKQMTQKPCKCERAIPVALGLAAAFSASSQTTTQLVALVIVQIAAGVTLLWVLYGR